MMAKIPASTEKPEQNFAMKSAAEVAEVAELRHKLEAARNFLRLGVANPSTCHAP